MINCRGTKEEADSDTRGAKLITCGLYGMDGTSKKE